ncbi:MAG: potassium channel family protein [Cyclobacteriaceae bacterium]|nr:potassium channel family protein [Cyclobacteriaceae bacterium]
MIKTIISRYLAKHSKERFYFLLASIVVFILLPPFTYNTFWDTLTIYLAASFTVVSCVIILFSDENKIFAGSGILIISLAFTWFTLNQRLDGIFFIPLTKSALLFMLFSATAFKVIKTMFGLKKVDAQIIAGSIGAYLLFGLSGAMLFNVIDLLYPASFDFSFAYGGGYDTVYFSFVTLSTLGYGDITPHTPQGQAVVIFVSIAGQLYMAILMAMLVGKFLKDSDW